MQVIPILLTLIVSSGLGDPTSVRKIGSRIIGGTPAYVGQFKFAAAINVQTSNSRYFCSGSLLTTEWILTAGQCVNNATLFTIQLGSNTLNVEDPNRVTVASSEYILHPDFNPTTLENDLGLIKLRLPIELTPYIEPILYIPAVPIQVSTSLLAIGWGQLNDENPDLADTLNWVQLTSLSNDECKLTYGNQVTDGMVCVGGNYDEGACIGDSGGALVHVVSRGQMVHAGISSFISSNGCTSTDPSGYTRTYTYLDWIMNITLA